jgi:hypothetical protein
LGTVRQRLLDMTAEDFQQNVEAVVSSFLEKVRTATNHPRRNNNYCTRDVCVPRQKALFLTPPYFCPVYF